MAAIFVSTTVSAQTVTTSSGSYLVQQSGSTTYVTQTSSGSNFNSGVNVAVPVTVNPITGIGMIHGPNGSSAVIRSGSTTTVIPLSGGGR